MCTNMEEWSSCLNRNMVWDPYSCSCSCPAHTWQPCSTGKRLAIFFWFCLSPFPSFSPYWCPCSCPAHTWQPCFTGKRLAFLLFLCLSLSNLGSAYLSRHVFLCLPFSPPFSILLSLFIFLFLPLMFIHIHYIFHIFVLQATCSTWRTAAAACRSPWSPPRGWSRPSSLSLPS